MIEATAEGIEVRTPYHFANLMKSIPGGRWSPAKRVWVYPLTEASATALADALPETMARNPEFVELVAAGLNSAVTGEAIKLTFEPLDMPQPKTQVGAQWGWQRRAYKFAETRPATMLSMAMGTGKTKVTIDLVQNSDDRRVLVIAKRKVGTNVWPRALAEWLAHPDEWIVDSLAGGGSVVKRTAAMKASMKRAAEEGLGYIGIVNYEAVNNAPLKALLLLTKWDRVVLDESQHISGHGSVRSKLIARLTARRRLALSGTPMRQTPLDVFGQYRFLDPGIFGVSWTRFKHHYARWGGYGGYQMLGMDNEYELSERFNSIAIKVERDVLELLPSQHITQHITLDPTTQHHYDAMSDDFITTLAGDKSVTAPIVLTKLLRMQQLTSGYLTTDSGEDVTLGTEKQDTLQELLEGLPIDEPVVVFVRFRHDLAAVHAAAREAGRSSLEVSGASDDITEWQGGAATVLAVQIQSGGEGIDLTRAAYCVYYSIGYSLGDYEQSLARVSRPGQTRHVTYYHLVAGDTVDEVVYDALDLRRNVIDMVLASVRRV